jgi:hypothetical protein
MIEVAGISMRVDRRFFPETQRCMFKPRVSPWFGAAYT